MRYHDKKNTDTVRETLIKEAIKVILLLTFAGIILYLTWF